MRNAYIAVLFVALSSIVACGGSELHPTVDLGANVAPIDERFSGEWSGDVLVDVSAAVPMSYGAMLHTTGDRHTVTVTGICPDGSGGFTAVGSGDTANWTGAGGDVECHVPESPCPKHAIRYIGAALSVSSEGLRVSLVAECGATSATAAFSGIPATSAPPTLR